MRRPPREAVLGIGAAILAMGGGLVALGMLTHETESSGTRPEPTSSLTAAGEPEPQPTLASTEFIPLPDACLDSLEPPPCADEAVSWISGFVGLAPTRLLDEASPGFATIAGPVSEFLASMSEGGIPLPNADDFEARAWDAEGDEVPGVTLDMMVFAYASAEGETEVGGPVVYFSILLPGTAGFTRVTLEENGTLVHEWIAGPRAPEVESITLTDGPDGPLIEWSATDADGDDLSYMAWLVDGNGIRQSLGFGPTTETSALVNPENPNGPGPHRAYVVVSDGINTSWAVTDPVQTANRPPFFLFWHDDGTEYATDSDGDFELELWGVQDPEGEDLDSQIVWTSSIDGYLTTGSSFDVYRGSVDNGPTLSVGRHQITGTVTDSGGASASLVFTLVVEP